MRLMLEHRGCKVTEARTEEHALELLDGEATPDLAILDLHLGEQSGLALLRRLRADPIFASLPALFASALPDREAVVGAVGLGIVEFLSKPVDSARLHRAVDAALARDWMQTLFRDPREVCAQRTMTTAAYLETARWLFGELGKLRSDGTGAIPFRPPSGGETASLEMAADQLGFTVVLAALRDWRQGRMETPSAVLTRVPTLQRLFNAYLSNRSV